MAGHSFKACVLRGVRWVGIGVLALVIVISVAWGAAALHYSNLPWGWARDAMAVAWVVGIAAIFVLVRPKRKALAISGAAFAALLVWWMLIPPKSARDWQRDVGVMATAKVEGDLLTITGVRNFTYRSETDFDEHWETRTYDLSKLRAMEISLTYWGSPAIAHSMVSFVFDAPGKPGGIETLCTSIETRKHGTQQYSTVAGFFKQYELIYIFGDERDLVGLRTNYRKEQVHLYRTVMMKEAARDMLMSYVSRANKLAVEPEWYNAFTQNCFTGVVELAKGAARNPINWPRRVDYRLVFNGYFNEVMYEAKVIDTSLPLEELSRRALVNPRVDGGAIGDDFSAKMREGLPVPAPLTPIGR